MKKFWIGLLVVVLSLSFVAFAACQDDNAAGKDYTAPTISAAADGLTISHADADSFEYKADDGEWTAVTGKIAYSESAGAHTVKVRVKAQDAKSAAEATYSYETKQVTLSDVTVSGDTASWTAVAYKVSIKVGNGEYQATTASSYRATEYGDTVITVKAEKGVDVTGKVVYVGNAVEKSGTVTLERPQTPKLATPTLSVNDDEDGLEWQSVANAVKYQVKVNDGNYADATSYAFATEAGSYTVSVIAKGDGENYADSEAATFTYTVKAASVTLSGKTANSVTISAFEGIALQYLDEDTYENLPFDLPYTYTAEESGIMTLKVVGGWKDANNTLYLEVTETASFTVAASSALVIENADGKVAADLSDEWTIKKYDANGWVDTSASIAVDTYGASDCVLFNIWNNSTVYRYGKGYDAQDGYNEIAFAAKGNGITRFRLQIANSESGIYATIDLGKLPAYWQEYIVAMNDANWKLTYGGNQYVLADVLSYLGVTDIMEVLKAFDTVNLLFDGSTSNGASAKMYMDDLQFVYAATPASSVSQPLTDISMAYYASNNDVYMTLTITSETEATLATVNLETNLSQDFTMEIDNDNATVTLKDKEHSGAGLTLNATFTYNGATATVTSVTGGAEASTKALLENAVFKAGTLANLTLDFGTFSANSDYSGTDWTYDYYGNNGWTAASGTQMRYRQGDGDTANQVINAYVDTTTRRYFYNKNGDLPLGLAQYFSVRLGNYYGSDDISYKIMLADTAGNLHYVAGDADNFAKLAKDGTNDNVSTRKFTTVSVTLTDAIDVQYFYFVVKCASGNTYIYLDDVALLFLVPTAELNLDDYDNIAETEDFSSYSGSFPLTTLHSNLTYSATAYVRNDSGAGYGDDKYLSAQYISNGTAAGTTKTLTYTPGDAPGRAAKFSFAIANDRNANAKESTITVKIYDANGTLLLNENFTIEAGAAWTLKQFTFTEAVVGRAEIVIANNAAGTGDGFMKFDSLAFSDGMAEE